MLGFDYSVWWLILVLLVAFALSFGLYYSTFKDPELKKHQKALMFALRFLGLVFLGFLLLKPFSKHLTSQKHKPQLIVLQDNSSSIIATGDSLKTLNGIQQQYQTFFKTLEAQDIPYTHYAFDKDILSKEDLTFSGKSTNIVKALKSATDLNIGNLTGGIALISDGIYNQGEHPTYYSKQLKTPIYTVGLGDTATYRDLSIENIDFNPVYFRQHKIHLKFQIKAIKSSSKTANIKILSKGKVLFKKAIAIKQDKYFKEIEVILPKMEVDVHALKFEIEPVEKEKNIYNNTQTIYFKVVDTQKKILLVYESPHPDVSAIGSVLEKHTISEVTKSNISKLNSLKGNYDLIILHQIPNRLPDTKHLTQYLSKHKTPIWFIISNQTAIKTLNQISPNVQFAKQLEEPEWSESTYNTNFKPFILSLQGQEFINNAPPLSSPSLKINLRGETDVLMYKKIKQVDTDQPLFFFSYDDNIRTAYTLGEGLWKWKMYDYRENDNNDIFKKIILKTIYYLTAPVNQSGLVTNIKNAYLETEEVKISANYYNDVNEVSNDNSLQIEYWKEKESKKQKVFSNQKASYICNLGRLESGKYQYQITSKSLNTINQSGTFIVKDIALESYSLIARHDILKSISDNTNGFFLEQNQWLSMVDSISKLDNFKPQSFSTNKNTPWINYIWLMLLIFICLATEWFLRKYWGVL